MEVFTNPYTGKPVSWSLQSCFLYIPGGINANSENNILAAAESVQISYQRALSKRYPLTSGSPITLIGVPQGSCQITTILGPKHSVDSFLEKFGNACNPFELVVGTNTNNAVEVCQESSTPQVITLKGCQGQALTFTLSTQQNIVIAQGVFALSFDSMDWSNAAPQQNA